MFRSVSSIVVLLVMTALVGLAYRTSEAIDAKSAPVAPSAQKQPVGCQCGCAVTGECTCPCCGDE